MFQLWSVPLLLVFKKMPSPSNYYVTLSITKSYTTYTTIIQLESGVTPTTTLRAVPSTLQYLTSSTVGPIISSSGSNISGTTIGIIVLCILVPLFLLLAFCACCRKGGCELRASEGLRGPPGEPGPMGERGLRGFQGEQGLRGFQGEQGLRGLQGGQGPRVS